MNVHKNARLTARGRERIVRQVASGQTPEAVAEAAGVCPRAASAASANTRVGGCRDRAASPAALDRQADRSTGRLGLSEDNLLRLHN